MVLSDNLISDYPSDLSKLLGFQRDLLLQYTKQKDTKTPIRWDERFLRWENLRLKNYLSTLTALLEQIGPSGQQPEG